MQVAFLPLPKFALSSPWRLSEGHRSCQLSNKTHVYTAPRLCATAGDKDLSSNQHQHHVNDSNDTLPLPTITSSTNTDENQSDTAEQKTSEPRGSIDYELGPGEVGVRFINTPSGSDVVAAARPGEPLLAVGDSVGIRIPRACQSGLCGSCTCDVLDSTLEEGRQTIRACQAKVAIPDGGPELIVDVERMKAARTMKDPMARFENIDTDYIAGAAPRPSSRATRSFQQQCADCHGTGVVVCYNCDGSGIEDVVDGESYVCYTCIGMKDIRCPTCQGDGEVTIRR